MAEEGNTSWKALRREFPIDEERAAFYDRVIGVQLELARRLEGRGVDGTAVMRILEEDNDRLETMVREGREIDFAGLADQLSVRVKEGPSG